MANNGTLKMKMLALWEILKQESDAARPLSTNDICRKLQERGIPCERKSVINGINKVKFKTRVPLAGGTRVWVGKRQPPAMPVRQKEFYLCREIKVPND